MSLISPDHRLEFSYKIRDIEDFDWGDSKMIDVEIKDSLSTFRFMLHGKNGEFEKFINMVCEMQEEFESRRKVKESSNGSEASK